VVNYKFIQENIMNTVKETKPSYTSELAKDVLKAGLISTTSILVGELIQVVMKRSREAQDERRLAYDEFSD
jgi:hypothetical protein